MFAVEDQKAETIARLLVEHVVARHGVPQHLLSDIGPTFLSALVQEVRKLLGTIKVNTSGYHPQCDGLMEKFNSTFINMLSKSVDKSGRDWDMHLPYLVFAYQVSVQESTGASPCKVENRYYQLQKHLPNSDRHTSWIFMIMERNLWLICLTLGPWPVRISKLLRQSRNDTMTAGAQFPSSK